MDGFLVGLRRQDVPYLRGKDRVKKMQCTLGRHSNTFKYMYLIRLQRRGLVKATVFKNTRSDDTLQTYEA